MPVLTSSPLTADKPTRRAATMAAQVSYDHTAAFPSPLNQLLRLIDEKRASVEVLNGEIGTLEQEREAIYAAMDAAMHRHEAHDASIEKSVAERDVYDQAIMEVSEMWYYVMNPDALDESGTDAAGGGDDFVDDEVDDDNTNSASRAMRAVVLSARQRKAQALAALEKRKGWGERMFGRQKTTRGL